MPKTTKDWEEYAVYDALRPSRANKKLKLRDAGDHVHLNIGIETTTTISGFELRDEDAIDLAERILTRLAPDRLAQSGTKLDDRFKVGDWVERRHPSLNFSDLNGPLQILEIRPYTEAERRILNLVSKGAVSVRYTKDGQESYIASNWLIPSDAPEPPKLAEQVGKFFQNISSGEIVRVIGPSARRDSNLDRALAEKENGSRREIYNQLGLKDWWFQVDVEETIETIWTVKD